MQGVKSIDKFHDFLAEVDGYQLDLLLVAETLRGEHEKTFFTADGHRFFLSGGSAGRHGVAIVAGRMRMAYVKRGLSCIFRPVAFITLQFGRCSFQFFFVICLRRGIPTTKLRKFMTSVLLPQQWWRVTSMQSWLIREKGMPLILWELVDSDHEMTENG